jgi:predicted nuclease with TOPRIM domain
VGVMPDDVIKEVGSGARESAVTENHSFKAVSKYDLLTQRIDWLDKKVDRLDDKVGRLDDKFDAVNRRIDSVNGEIKSLDERFNARMNRFEDKMDRFEDKLDSNNKWSFGQVITMIVGFAGIIVTLWLTLHH